MSSSQLARSSGRLQEEPGHEKQVRDAMYKSRAGTTTAPWRPAPLGAPTSPLQRGARLETLAQDTTTIKGEGAGAPGGRPARDIVPRRWAEPPFWQRQAGPEGRSKDLRPAGCGFEFLV